jgi:hypothetical protein
MINYFKLSISCTVCRVLKVFRTGFSPGPITRVMKLNKRKIHWIIRQKQKGVSTNKIALDMKISRRRVQQVWKSYKTTGQEPAIGENMGRPKKLFVTGGLKVPNFGGIKMPTFTAFGFEAKGCVDAEIGGLSHAERTA